MRVFFSAGDPSGDQHAAHVIHALRRLQPDVQACGLGGPAMRAAGCDLLAQLTDCAVMGFFRVLPLLHKFYRLYRRAEHHFRRTPPDVVVLVDFPGFNWWVARAAHRHGIPVVYYLPPQLWAWAGWRVRRMHRHVTRVLSGLEFETDWYHQRGVDARFVGHPFFDHVAETPLDPAFRSVWRTDALRNVALLPGSRRQEVLANWPTLQAAAEALHRRFPDTRFLVACYRNEHRRHCEARYLQTAASLPIHFFTNKTPEILDACTCAIQVSGSVSLELLARRKPAVVTYRVNRLYHWVGRQVIRCRFLSLPNLMLDEELYPEVLIGGDFRPHVPRIVEPIARWLSDPAALTEVTTRIDALASHAARPGASLRAAEQILDVAGVPAAGQRSDGMLRRRTGG
ncbi:MAG: lipid-A-disaccharide synthase, partial [Planctomycetota bacterium]